MVFLPFALPHAGLQNLRRSMFYWRAVYNYRLLQQTGALTGDKCVEGGARPRAGRCARQGGRGNGIDHTLFPSRALSLA
jgi:hypothetical protein